MKKIFATAIILMFVLTLVVFSSSSVFGVMDDDGFAVPSSQGIHQALSSETLESVELIKVNYDDIVYKSAGGYFVGEDRNKIDISYPLFARGGQGLRFFGEDNHLITPDAEVYQSFTGLYVSEGISYNFDMTRADNEEFIMLSLPNGLYMNVQHAKFKSAEGESVVPVNSILLLKEDNFSWYSFSDGALSISHRQPLSDSTLTIGEHEYNYTDLLDAMGLIREALETNSGKPDEEKLEEAEIILNKKAPGGIKNPAGGNSETSSKLEDTDVSHGDISSSVKSDRTDNNSNSEFDENFEDSGNYEDSSEEDGYGEDESDQEDTNSDTDTGNSEENNEDKDEGSEGEGDGSEDDGHKPESGESSGGNPGEHDGENEDETETETLPEGEGTGEEGTDIPPEYLIPSVSIDKLEPWTYALNIDLNIDDPSGVIVRGVRISVYRDIKGDKSAGLSYINDMGFECYPSTDYEGKSAILRKTKTVSDEFPINTLPPGDDVYLQYNYRYNIIKPNKETGVDKISRKYVYSDLIRISVPEIEGNVEPFAASWDTAFAQDTNSLTLQNMDIRNTSNYDPDAEKYTFENFKLDTLPYIARLELVVKEEGSADEKIKIIPVTGSAIKNAVAGEKPAFRSGSPKLDSNKKYSYEVRAKDRFGNLIPSKINGSSQYEGTVYTRKMSPKVTISEKENITDSLTIIAEVSDPDGTLDPSEPLIFSALNSKTSEKAYLEGTVNGKVISSEDGYVKDLQLLQPEDGAKYEIKMSSLAFAQSYKMVVTGNYDPQPDFTDAPEKLDKIENEEIGNQAIYTASLSSGVIGFSTSTENLLDTSATLNAKMTKETTVEMLPLVDEFRFIITEDGGKEVIRSVIKREDLIKDGYVYDEESASILLEEGNGERSRTYLYGKKNQFTKNPWESFCIDMLEPVEGSEKIEYTDPMTFKMDIPKGKLDHNTPYKIKIQAVVIKSGQEYLIPVSLTNSVLRTKKTIPQIQYSDLFLVADRAEFLDIKIFDPDATILNDGRVTLQLFRDDTRLAVKELIADSSGNAPVEDIIFDGLISGEEYSIKFFAEAYNDAEGYGSYETNHLLKTFNFIAGRSLFGSLTLNDLGKSDSDDGSYIANLHVQTDDTKGYLLRNGEKPEVKLLIEHSDSMEMPQYDEKPFLEEIIKLVPNGDGSLSLDTVKVFDGLYPDDGYRATLSTYYQGKYVLLDRIEFRTDTPYVTVSTHKELIDAQKKDSKANILVVSDFVQDQNTAISGFNGTIDFQGHVVTKGDKITTCFLRLGTLGKVKNLVYDYPQDPYYVNPASIFENLNGKVENLIVRTGGNIEINRNSKSIIASSISTTGKLENLIVKLNGDLITSCEEDNTVGAIISSVNGELKNAYVYGRGGYIGRRAARGSSLWGYSYYNGTMENVFSIIDSWYQPNNNNYFLHAQKVYAAKVDSYYNVGDYYHIGQDENKTYLVPLNYIPFAPDDNYAQVYDNVWAVTGRGYKDMPDFVNTGSIALLSDINWQKSVLGDGFDIEGPVKMGFYPRLKLPNSMQKYQEYIPLPKMGDIKIPEIISDSWDNSNEHSHNLESGYITLKLKNDSNYNIDKIEIEGLDTLIVEQGANTEGLYEVCLNAKVSEDEPEYLSQYKVTGITYNIGNMSRTAVSDYVTKNIEFWKSVDTPREWAEMNSNMDWNYKITSDLDFAKTNLIPAEMMINGSRTSMNATRAFTGKLDGQEHVISNFKLENILYPYIFYQTADAEVKNLFFDNLYISASNKTTRNVTGIIGLSYRSNLENIRLKNSTILGTGRCGYICGHTQYGTVKGCSVTDSYLGDVNTGITLTMGGIAGESYSHMHSCYTNNLTIEVTNTTVVNTVAGLVGYINANLVENCYTKGSIKVSGNYVGGLIGKAPVGNAAHTKQCIAYVDITQISGDYAGGYAGLSPSGENSIVLGNVSGAGNSAHRIKGELFQACNAYAFSGQIVGQLKETDKDDAKGLISGERLSRMDTWQDDIRLGSAWNYEPVKRGSLPKVKFDAQRDGWQQKDIYLPGQSGDPVLKITEAVFDGKKYGVYAEFDHPGIPHETIKEIVSISFDGMDISDASQQAGKASCDILKVSDEKSNIVITTDTFLKALDTYPLVVKYKESSGRERELTVMVEFKYKSPTGEPHHNWWEVSNIGEWNQTIKEHGKTNENIMITGEIDFTGHSANPDNRNLSFNRLAGKDASCGFVNLKHQALSDSQPWIEKIGIDLSNLYFKNFIIDFGKSEVNKPMNGAVLSVNDASDLVIENLVMSGNRYSRNNFGFISNASGKINNISLKHVNVYDTEPKLGSNFSGASAFIASSNNDIDNVKAEDITVSRPKNTRVGGIVGNATYYGPSFCNNSITNFSVTGYSDTGAVSGGNFAGTADNLSAVNGKVQATATAGGLIGYVSMYQNRTNKNRNWEVKNVDVISDTGTAGGITGTTFHFQNKYMLVENCSITGEKHVGGVAGAINNGTIYLYDVEVVNCSIINNGDVVLEPDNESTGTGGIAGRLITSQTFDLDSILVRNCNIEGPNYVGGIVGSQVRNNKGTNIIQHAYVAEDVNITCKNRYAGGISGYSEIINIKNSACGASVRSDVAAGGIIGKVNPINEEISTILEKVYLNGKVYSVYNYAGGVIGMLNSSSLKTSDANMKNILVHADVRAGGPDASLWVNDTMPVGDAGTGFIYISEDSVLNGQKASAIKNTAESSGRTTYIVPSRKDDINLLIPTSKFKEVSFYKDVLKFSDTDWQFSLDKDNNKLLDTYMPFTKNNDKNGILKNLDRVYDKAADKYLEAGILLPEFTKNEASIAVYAAGPDILNIEVNLSEGEPSRAINVNGSSINTDNNGVISLKYDFAADFTVNDVSYSPSQLSRKVMTFGDYFYYIHTDGTIHYGKAVGTDADEKEIGIVTGLPEKVTAVNLYQGKVLASDGKVYKLNGGNAELQSSQTEKNNYEVLEKSVPFCETGTIKVFHNFSYVSGVKIPYRVFTLSDQFFTVSPEQKTLYDGVILSKKMKFNDEYQYFALLGEDGKLHAYINNMVAGPLINEGIHHISNNIGYSGTVILAYYPDGTVIGVDYTTGTEVCNTGKTAVGFMSYVKNSLASLFGQTAEAEGKPEENIIEAEGLLKPEEEKIENNKDKSDIGKITDNQTFGNGGSGDADYKEGGKTPSEGSMKSEGETIAYETSAEEDAKSEISQNAEISSSETSSMDEEEGADGFESDLSGEISAEGPDAGDPNGIFAQPGQPAVSGEGQPNSNKLMSHDEEAPLNDKEIIKKTLGESVIMISRETGKLSEVKVDELLEGKELLEKKRSEYVKEDAKSDPTDKNNKNEANDSFNIFHGIKRELHNEEKQGFVLIALTFFAAFSILSVIYFKVIRRKRR